MSLGDILRHLITNSISSNKKLATHNFLYLLHLYTQNKSTPNWRKKNDVDRWKTMHFLSALSSNNLVLSVHVGCVSFVLSRWSPVERIIFSTVQRCLFLLFLYLYANLKYSLKKELSKYRKTF